MADRSAGISLAALMAGVALVGSGIVALSAGGPPDHRPVVSVREPVPSPAVTAALSELPLVFEENRGQADPEVGFLARGDGYTLSLAPDRAVFGLPGTAVSMRFVGAATPTVEGRSALPGSVNYLRGSDPSGWQTSVPTYDAVRYDDLYPGIDLVFHGGDGGLEYDFVVSPGADPTHISFSFHGATGPVLNAAGDLTVESPGGDFVQRAPVIYQQLGGVRQPVSGGFVIEAGGVGFELGSYDVGRRLVIDPQVFAYSTFVGGSGGDIANAIVVDGSGNAYITGRTSHDSYPTPMGAFDDSHNGSNDVFVTKLDPAGSAIVYSTFVGGTGTEQGHAIAIDGAGNAYVTGQTNNASFPTPAGAFDESYNGADDAFALKLDPTGGALLYSTFLGSTASDAGHAIVVDGAGNAYVTGRTAHDSFPTSSGAYDESQNGSSDAFVTKVNPAGSDLAYSTFLGSTAGDDGFGIAVDGSGIAYVTGDTGDDTFPTVAGAFDDSHNGDQDIFVTRVNAAGDGLLSSTFIGGIDGDYAYGIALDGAGNAYVTGETYDDSFPTPAGAFDDGYAANGDGFVSKVNAGGSSLLYSTFLGGSGIESLRAIAVDGMGQAHVTGYAEDGTYPTTSGALDESHDASDDAVVTKLNAAGTGLLYSTFLGGAGSEIGHGVAIDGAGAAYVTGYATDDTFPTTTGAFDDSSNGSFDAFVTKIAEVDVTAPDTFITKGPKKKSTKRKSTFEFESSEAGSTFECKIDKKPFAACTSPKKQKAKVGKHTFQVRATDAAGNVDGTPAKRKFKRVEPG